MGGPEPSSQPVALPTRIAVKDSPFIRACVPGFVFRQPPFRWMPAPFMPKGSNLVEGRVFDASVQDQGLHMWMTDPKQPCVYCVTGEPSDNRALYFAAFLVGIHAASLKRGRVYWQPMYGSGRNELLDLEPGSASLLVLTNLSPNSTQYKFERAKDIMMRHRDTPIIVVGSGCDPITLMSSHLYAPVHAVAHFSEKIIKSQVV